MSKGRLSRTPTRKPEPELVRVILEHGLSLNPTSPRVCRKCKRYDRDPVVVGKQESIGAAALLAFCRVCVVGVLVDFDEHGDLSKKVEKLEEEVEDLEGKLVDKEARIDELENLVEDLETEVKKSGR